MENELNNRIEKYSHGMRQKIIIIGALLHEPKNLILDEPITGLDPKITFDLKNIMREYAEKGNTVFFSTHILELAMDLCDEIVILNDRKLELVEKNNLNAKKYKDKIINALKDSKND